MNRLFVSVAGILLFAFSIAAQSQSPQNTSGQAAPSNTTLRSTTQEVVLDMVFRDKKGRTIRDIRPEEVHISEDGVEQKVNSFRIVEGKTAESSSESKASAESGSPSLDPMREVRLVTLVFEGLDQEGKRFFRQSLKDILDMAPEQNLYFSILTIDQKLHIIQPFTSDHSLLLKSADRSSMWSFIQYANNSAEVKAELKQVLSEGEPQMQGASGAGATGGPSQSQVQSVVNWRMAKTQYDMLQAADTADREYNVRATIDALTALVRAQSELPGRKVILYFNPWLFISETVQEQYRNLISMANRAN